MGDRTGNQCSDVYTAESILKRRRRGGRAQFLVKWKGWSHRDNTWEPEQNILDRSLIEEFEEKQSSTEESVQSAALPEAGDAADAPKSPQVNTKSPQVNTKSPQVNTKSPPLSERDARMAMAPEIQEYYDYLLGETEVMPGPIVLPDGFSPDDLAKVIFHTLVKKAAMLSDAHQVQILYSAWAILNDAYTPVRTGCASVQTPEPGCTSDSAVQTHATAVSAVQTQTAAGPGAVHALVQTVPGQVRPVATQTEPAQVRPVAAQTEPVQRRTKWTQMRRRALAEVGCQAGCAASALISSEMQTMLCRGSTVATQTHRSRRTWTLVEVEGAPPPPQVRSAFISGVEDKTYPRAFHGRKLKKWPRAEPVPIRLHREGAGESDAETDAAPEPVHAADSCCLSPAQSGDDSAARPRADSHQEPSSLPPPPASQPGDPRRCPPASPTAGEDAVGEAVERRDAARVDWPPSGSRRSRALPGVQVAGSQLCLSASFLDAAAADSIVQEAAGALGAGRGRTPDASSGAQQIRSPGAGTLGAGTLGACTLGAGTLGGGTLSGGTLSAGTLGAGRSPDASSGVEQSRSYGAGTLGAGTLSGGTLGSGTLGAGRSPDASSGVEQHRSPGAGTLETLAAGVEQFTPAEPPDSGSGSVSDGLSALSLTSSL